MSLVAGPLNVTWPDTVVLDAAARAQGSAGRFTVLGVGRRVAAARLLPRAGRGPTSRPAPAAARCSGRRGARPGQVLGVATLQAAFAVVVGLVVGDGGRPGLVVALTRGLVPDPGRGALHALAVAWPVVLGLGVAAVLGSVLLAAGPPVRDRAPCASCSASPSSCSPAVSPLLALVRPTPDPRAPLPVAALVGLTLAAGLLGALLWSPVVAALGAGSGPEPGRTAAADRPPDGPAAPAAQRDRRVPRGRAGHRVPGRGLVGLDATFRARTRRPALVPLDARGRPEHAGAAARPPSSTPTGWPAVAPDVVVAPVTSTVVSAFAGTGGATALPLTGLDPDVLPLVHRWSAVTGSSHGRRRGGRPAADADHPDPRPGRPGRHPSARPRRPRPRRRRDARPLGRRVRTGRSARSGSPSAATRRTRTCARGRPWTSGPSRSGSRPTTSTRRQHGIGEGSTDRPLPAGTLRFGAVHADGAPCAWSWTGWGADSVTVARPTRGRRAERALPDPRRPRRAAALLGARRAAAGAPGRGRRGDRGPGRRPRHVRPHGQPDDAARPRRGRAPPDADAAEPVRASPTGRPSPRWSTAPRPGTGPVAQVWVARTRRRARRRCGPS